MTKSAVELVQNQKSLGFFDQLGVGVGYLNRFQGCQVPYTNTGTVQEISQISCTGLHKPFQSIAIWFVHSTHGVHCSGEGGESDGHTQGYKDPPVPRQLVGES